MSLGPECAVLTSIGTVYLYRLGRTDMGAYSQLPATRLSMDKLRNLLALVASTSVSDKGARDAGTLRPEQIDALSDEELERVAEAWLESPSVRWYQQEGAAASPPVVRNRGEPAAKFLDRLIHWCVASLAGGPSDPPGSGTIPPGTATIPPGPATIPPMPAPKPPLEAMEPRLTKEMWIALGVLLLVAILALGVLLRDYFMLQALRREQDALATQLRESNALARGHIAHAVQENAELRRRIEALEAALHAQAQAAAKAREAKAAAAAKAAAKPRTTESRTRPPPRLHR